MKPTDFSKYLSDYLSKYLPGERGMSHNSILAYRDTFILLIRYYKDAKHISVNKLTMDKLTRKDIVAFLDWLQNENKCSDSTRNARLAALRSFFSYVGYEDPTFLNEGLKIHTIPLKKTGRKSINYLTVDGIRLLLKQPNLLTKSGRRDMALLSLMYDTDARVQEIADLTVECLRLTKPYTIRMMGKGQKVRIVPLIEQQVLHLQRYMADECLFDSKKAKMPLFSSGCGRKLTRSGISYILNKYVSKARVESATLIPEKVSCHSLRHSRAMHLLQADVPLIYIRDLLGHESVVTTEIYARVDSKRKREVITNAFVPTSEEPNEPVWLKDTNLLDWLKSL